MFIAALFTRTKMWRLSTVHQQMYFQCTVIRPVISIGVVLQQHKNENLRPRERQSDEEQIGAEGEEKQRLTVDVRFIRVKGDKGYSRKTGSLCTGLLCGVFRE